MSETLDPFESITIDSTPSAARIWIDGVEEHKLGGIRRNIPFLEAWSVANPLIDSLKDPNIDKISIAGSLRRMKSTINDIDIIASVRKTNKENGKWSLEKFIRLDDVKRVISMGDVHVSETPIYKLEQRDYVQLPDDKPKGFWYGFGDEWIDWIEIHVPESKSEYL